MAEVVELETGGPDGGQDGCIVDVLSGDFEFPSAEDEVCVGGCAGMYESEIFEVVFLNFGKDIHDTYPNGSPTTRKAISDV